MENFTVEQMGAAYGLAKILSENDRREAEAVQGYTEQLAAILRAQEAFAGVFEVLEFLERLESATKEKIADELSHSDSLRKEYTDVTGIAPKED